MSIGKSNLRGVDERASITLFEHRLQLSLGVFVTLQSGL